MSQRHSGYNGDNEFYTPSWVTEALLSVEIFDDRVWEPAPGKHHMVDVLLDHKYQVMIGNGEIIDFLQHPGSQFIRAIITNPPYSIAPAFVRHALELMQPAEGMVAMLLPHAWDCAKGRRDLFTGNEYFVRKWTLTKRIRWEGIEQKKANPSSHHAWFVWDFRHWKHSGPPTLGYLP